MADKKKAKKKKAPPKFAKPGDAATSKQKPVRRGQPLQFPGVLGTMVPR